MKTILFALSLMLSSVAMADRFSSTPQDAANMTDPASMYPSFDASIWSDAIEWKLIQDQEQINADADLDHFWTMKECE